MASKITLYSNRGGTGKRKLHLNHATLCSFSWLNLTIRNKRGIWRDGSLGKRTCSERMRTWISIASFHSKASHSHEYRQPTVLGVGDSSILGVHWTQASKVRFRFSDRHCLENKVESDKERHAMFLSGLHMCANLCTHNHTYSTQKF